MDRLDAMQAFAAVVDTGGFAAAGRRLNRSTAMVSRLVQALESHLGVRLLLRNTRQVTATATGRAYYERISMLLAELDEADAQAAQEAREPRGLLRVNAPMSFAIRHLGAVFSAFMLRHPQVRLDVVLNDRRVDLIEEGFDVVIRIGELGDTPLVARRLATARAMLCAAPDYLLRRGTPRSVAALAEHDCLIYAPAAGAADRVWRFERDGAVQTVAVDGPYQSNNGDLLIAAALAGRGILRHPDFLVAPLLAQGRLLPLLPDYPLPQLPIHALYAQRRHLSAKVRGFVDFLAEHFAGTPPWARELPH